MTKEVLTPEHVKEDLLRLIETQKDQAHAVGMVGIGAPVLAVGIVLSLFFGSFFVMIPFLLAFGFVVFHYARKLREKNERRRLLSDGLSRGEYSVTREVLTNAVFETVYEPHKGPGRRMKDTKQVCVLYFESGGSWRIPGFNKHYAWSKEFYISTEGLYNTAVAGNEFYLVSLREDYEIRYAYNAKFFDARHLLAAKEEDGAK